MKILLVVDDITLNQNIKEYLIQEDCLIDIAFDGQMAEKILNYLAEELRSY